jgi:hypothetical protein
MHNTLQEMWMPLVSTVAVWDTDHNKIYPTNSGGTATYSCSVFDRINDYMTQIQALVEVCTPVATIFSFFTSFFLNPFQNTQ